MSIPLISEELAQQLNEEVQEKIDSRLFLFCNYKPSPHVSIGEDATYLIAIQDLYKFAKDSCCILKKHRDFLNTPINRLDAILNTIDMLRAVTDHNQSPKNGRIEQGYLDKYDEWLVTTLGKSRPETAEDFSKLNNALRILANELIQLIRLFILQVSTSSVRSTLVNKWIDYTLLWYTSPTKQDIYVGQIMDTYLSKAVANGKSYPELYDTRQLKGKASAWLKAALCHPINTQLNELQEDIDLTKRALSGTSILAQQIRAQLTEDQQKELVAEWNEKLKENEEKLEKLQTEKSELQSQIGRNPFPFFFDKLADRLRGTMQQLEDVNIPYTLLPQELIQEDIYRFFNNVPSPKGDF